jgi:hypothetical protein
LSVLENQTLSEQARHAVGEIISGWSATNGFNNIEALDAALAFRLETEPSRCVAQVFDVGQARSPKDILALLLYRLGAKGWKKEPSDTKAWPFARSVMNYGKRRGGVSSIRAILKSYGIKKGGG